ncbi:DMT family transporter [Shouchella lonarensis]|uniref:EamA domain-containing membrane protein RarD n=1 Tax=Shouchella lonarensis TaxID=1464122 RepID=A0A1G6NT93_9BACI|nr:DMT family transporter [Shouchella lonarensis]SDC71220.1 EamA domain-containing membrane protein RarD [Shouchella lonarensis]
MAHQDFTTKKQWHAAVQMIITMMIFGSVGYFAIQTNLPSFELVFMRCLFGTIFLVGCWLVTGEYKRETWTKKGLFLTLICGVFLVFNWVFFFKALEAMSMTITVSVYHLAPVFVLLAGSIIFRERLTVRAIIAIVACFVGTMFVAGMTAGFSVQALFSSGMIWGLLAATFYAATTLLGKGMKQMSAYAMTFLQTFLGLFLLLPFVDFDAFLGLTTYNWLYVIGTGVIHTGIVYYLFFNSLRNLSSRVISILVFLNPAVAMLLDVALIGFRPTTMQLIGVVLIFFGMAFAVWRK